ncbi:MAG: hypothetical protein KUL78_03245 [Flavobacterium sp.]|nr:hypothetical protein [Flavobacterium sp.]
MKANIKGLHKSIIGANQDYLRDVLNMSKLIEWWKNENNPSLNRKEVLNLAARFFSLSLLTPLFIIENCGQSKEIDGKLVIVQKQRNKITGKYELSDLPVIRFSPSIAGNAIKNYCYKQQALISASQPVKPIEKEKTDLISEQAKEVEKTAKRVNQNKRQTAANATAAKLKEVA